MKSNLPPDDFAEMLSHLISENQKVLKEIKAKTGKKEEEFGEVRVPSDHSEGRDRPKQQDSSVDHG